MKCIYSDPCSIKKAHKHSDYKNSQGSMNMVALTGMSSNQIMEDIRVIQEIKGVISKKSDAISI